MKEKKFVVTFIEGDNLTIYALNVGKALFLAAAEKIKIGQPYLVDCIFEENSSNFFVTKKESLITLLEKR
jgi:hypothetical protein